MDSGSFCVTQHVLRSVHFKLSQWPVFLNQKRLMPSILMLPLASSGDDQSLWRMLKNIFCLNNTFLRALAPAISVIRKSACIKLIWMYCLGTEEESACVYDVCVIKWMRVRCMQLTARSCFMWCTVSFYIQSQWIHQHMIRHSLL